MFSYLPSFKQVIVETICVILATLIAAYFISRFPKLAEFVSNNSVTVKT